MIGMEHQSGDKCDNYKKQSQLRLLPVTRDPAGKPVEKAVAKPEHFQQQQGKSDVEGSNIPSVANILDRDHGLVRQYIAECKSEEEE